MRATSTYDEGSILRFRLSMLSLAEAIERSEPEPQGAEGEVEQLRQWDERLGG